MKKNFSRLLGSPTVPVSAKILLGTVMLGGGIFLTFKKLKEVKEVKSPDNNGVSILDNNTSTSSLENTSDDLELETDVDSANVLESDRDLDSANEFKSETDVDSNDESETGSSFE